MPKKLNREQKDLIDKLNKTDLTSNSNSINLTNPNNDIYNLYSFNMTELHDFLTKKEFNFVNVTIPYKQEVIKYLDVISDSASNWDEIYIINKVTQI